MVQHHICMCVCMYIYNFRYMYVVDFAILFYRIIKIDYIFDDLYSKSFLFLNAYFTFFIILMWNFNKYHLLLFTAIVDGSIKYFFFFNYHYFRLKSCVFFHLIQKKFITTSVSLSLCQYISYILNKKWVKIRDFLYISYTSSSIDASGTGECDCECDGAGGSCNGAILLFEVLVDDELAVAAAAAILVLCIEWDLGWGRCVIWLSVCTNWSNFLSMTESCCSTRYNLAPTVIGLTFPTRSMPAK